MTTIVSAVVIGVVVLLAGNLPWAGLGTWNFRAGNTLPWAVPLMAAYLWVYWRVLGGRWSAPAEAEWFRRNLRANRLSPRLWGAALGAGALGFAALLALLAVAARLVILPGSAPIEAPAGMPVVTVVLLLAMQSVVAGVTEEAAFRGYMQGPIERRYGLGVAILVNGLAFGLLHFGNHPRDVVMMLPYYVAVSAVYGGLTWAADSILPALVLHSVGDVVVLTRWWATGRPEWQLTAAAPALIREQGVDAAFVVAMVAALALTGATAWVYRALRARRERWAAAP